MERHTRRQEQFACSIKKGPPAEELGLVFFWVALVCTTRRGKRPRRLLCITRLLTQTLSFLDMINSAAANFPASVYEPPPESASNAPALNLNLGGVNVSLGGPAGSGVYRTSGESTPSIQADGIRDGLRSLFGKVQQGVDRIGQLQ